MKKDFILIVKRVYSTCEEKSLVHWFSMTMQKFYECYGGSRDTGDAGHDAWHTVDAGHDALACNGYQTGWQGLS